MIFRHGRFHSDEDGLTNRQELELGTDISNVDSDEDGIIDGVEVSAGLDPLDSADGALDPDNDGLTNTEEIGLGGSGTDHNKWDTDGDGYPDGYEVNKKADPNSSKDWPVFDEQFICKDVRAVDGETFADLDEDGRHEWNAEFYYGDDYVRNSLALECVCTIEILDEMYGKVEDVIAFAPTPVHDNSAWETSGDPKPQFVSIKVPFASSSRSDGIFHFKKFILNERLDLHKNNVTHWETLGKGSITSDEAVVSLVGEYTVWVAVENAAEVLIGNESDFSDGCPRLSGDDSLSGYEGYMRLEFDVAPPSISVTEDDSSTASSLTQTSRFMLAPGDNKRLRLLSISGSSNFSRALIERASISDWSTTEQVALHVPGQPPLILTASHPSRAFSEPVLLHQLDVQVASSENGAALPELELTHVLPSEPAPQLPGEQFPLTWQQFDTFLSSANAFLSVSSLLPEETDSSLQALAVRMLLAEEGQSWLHIDARGSGSLLRLPINNVSDGSWTFNTQGDELTLKGTVETGASDALSLTIESGSVGGLVLDEATLSLGGD